MTQLEKIFLFSIVVLLFQITRNINTTLYVSILFLSYLALYSIYLAQITINQENKSWSRVGISRLIFVASLCWLPMVSFFHLTPDLFTIAFSRYFVTLPFIVFCILYQNYRQNFVNLVLKVLVLFISLAALTVPVQVFLGHIAFFATPSYREGLVRYASLAGSLTALGSLGGYALAILAFSEGILFNRRISILLFLMISVGMLMSLQKSAVVNMVIVFAFYFLFSGRINFLRMLVITCFLISAVYVMYMTSEATTFSRYSTTILNYSFNGSNVDVINDLYSRLWDRPSEVILFHKIDTVGIFLGIGFAPLSGILGLVDYPMAHNNYFDILFSGGIIHLTSFLYLILRIPIKIWIKKIHGHKVTPIDRIYCAVIVLIMVNMAIGSSTFYQPICAVFTFFFIFSYRRGLIGST